jgi:hypothetical protein
MQNRQGTHYHCHVTHDLVRLVGEGSQAEDLDAAQLIRDE